jgi:hypothetical protein
VQCVTLQLKSAAADSYQMRIATMASNIAEAEQATTEARHRISALLQAAMETDVRLRAAVSEAEAARRDATDALLRRDSATATAALLTQQMSSISAVSDGVGDGVGDGDGDKQVSSSASAPASMAVPLPREASSPSLLPSPSPSPSPSPTLTVGASNSAPVGVTDAQMRVIIDEHEEKLLREKSALRERMTTLLDAAKARAEAAEAQLAGKRPRKTNAKDRSGGDGGGDGGGGGGGSGGGRGGSGKNNSSTAASAKMRDRTAAAEAATSAANKLSTKVQADLVNVRDEKDAAEDAARATVARLEASLEVGGASALVVTFISILFCVAP